MVQSTARMMAYEEKCMERWTEFFRNLLNQSEPGNLEDGAVSEKQSSSEIGEATTLKEFRNVAFKLNKQQSTRVADKLIGLTSYIWRSEFVRTFRKCLRPRRILDKVTHWRLYFPTLFWTKQSETTTRKPGLPFTENQVNC